MESTEWSLREIKRLKFISLLQFNLVMLVIALFGLYYARAGWPVSILLVLFSIAVWGYTLLTIYTWSTGNLLGTKSSRIVQRFDRERTGHKSWRRKKMVEIVVLGITAAGFTVFLIMDDFNDAPTEFYTFWPFIAGWIGTNIGTVFRIVALD